MRAHSPISTDITKRPDSDTTRHAISARARQTIELLSERDRTLPVWIRSPKAGTEQFTGLSRAKLYELAADKKIRSVSIRAPGQIKGTRLFHLGSIFDFIERCEAEANSEEGS